MNVDVDTKAVDDIIYSCLNLDEPISFFLFAGAGSGKTRSLVEVLRRFRGDNADRLKFNAQQVAIITYTNAASDEIKRRLEFDSAFSVSTIHSFSWELIKPHQTDIREWLRVNLQAEISKLEEAQQKGRAGTKAAEDRPRQISAKKKRLDSLDSCTKFNYSPSGDNVGRDSLNHSEVISITADLLDSRTRLQQVLVRKYPILLVDESQDTKKELIEALFNVQSKYKGKFVLGLFGDIMQRIYSDGKSDLGISPLPDDWLTPIKKHNHRCPRRVVKLINKIRSKVDDNEQFPVKEREGFVRLFIADTNHISEKDKYEDFVCQKMADITGDQLWTGTVQQTKTLTLEHHMSAARGGFSSFFDPLYSVDKLKTGLLDGSNSSIKFVLDQIVPLVHSLENSDQFSISRIVTKFSPLVSNEYIKDGENPKKQLKNAKKAVDDFHALWANDADPTLISIVKEVHRSNLFILPVGFKIVAERSAMKFEEPKGEFDQDPIYDAWDEALKTKFSEFESYALYISDGSRFGTHQGIKGLQFPRVVVVLDDGEARGFMFSYDKLFGATPASATDLRNEKEGKETSVDRTRRLFYVACSRAEESLAIVAYSSQPDKVKKTSINNGWFEETEIISSTDGNM